MEEKEKENQELDSKKDVQPTTKVIEKEDHGEHTNNDAMQKIREDKLLKSALIIERMLREKIKCFSSNFSSIIKFIKFNHFRTKKSLIKLNN